MWRITTPHCPPFIRGDHVSGVSESTPAVFRVFLSDPESFFHFGSSRSLRGHFLRKKWINFGWTDGSRSLNRSRIHKFEKFPDLDSKILVLERSWSLKKWIRPPLPFIDVEIIYFNVIYAGETSSPFSWNILVVNLFIFEIC